MDLIKSYDELTDAQKLIAQESGYCSIAATARDQESVDYAIRMMRSGESFACTTGAMMLQNRKAIKNALYTD